MSILAAIYTIAFIFIIIFSFTRPKIGLALFIVYFLFVPRIKLQLGPISIGEKFIYLVFIFSFIIKYGKKLKALIILFISHFFSIHINFFHYLMPKSQYIWKFVKLLPNNYTIKSFIPNDSIFHSYY